MENKKELSNHQNELEEILKNYINMPTDINEHLNTLVKYANKCNHVTEFGVRKGFSTIAFLNSNIEILKSYDIERHKKFKYEKLRKFASDKLKKLEFEFIIDSTLNIKIDETDLLFIDTLHIYKQLKEELKLHHTKVKKYIILHDIVTFGLKGEDKTEPGLWRAVIEFLYENDNWFIERFDMRNNGLLILHKSGS